MSITPKELRKKESESDDDEIKSVKGEPAKEFFVKMLTRDIELPDAILDLLDNCIDGILRNEGPRQPPKHRSKAFGQKSLSITSDS